MMMIMMLVMVVMEMVIILRANIYCIFTMCQVQFYALHMD